MKGSDKALVAWNQVPKQHRLKILNNVFCSNCTGAQSIGNAKAKLEKGLLVISGNCVNCASPVSRYVEPLNPVQQNILEKECYKKSIKLVSYAKGNKFIEVLHQLEPLRLKNFGEWKLENHELIDVSSASQLEREIYQDVLALGDRSCWEMEQVLPGFNSDDFDCPILKGIEIQNTQGNTEAIKYFKSLLKEDLRCIDAYVHIGNIYFGMKGYGAIGMAKTFYKKGVAVGLASIRNHIYDVFPWGFIDNRPFLRSFYGFALCLLKENKTEDALAIFKHILLLNPTDNQGARFIIADNWM